MSLEQMQSLNNVEIFAFDWGKLNEDRGRKLLFRDSGIQASSTEEAAAENAQQHNTSFPLRISF